MRRQGDRPSDVYMASRVLHSYTRSEARGGDEATDEKQSDAVGVVSMNVNNRVKWWNRDWENANV